MYIFLRISWWVIANIFPTGGFCPHWTANYALF